MGTAAITGYDRSMFGQAHSAREDSRVLAARTIDVYNAHILLIPIVSRFLSSNNPVYCGKISGCRFFPGTGIEYKERLEVLISMTIDEANFSRHDNKLVQVMLDDPETASKGGVQSVTRVVSILNCLCNDINSITDIAHSCKLHRATVHRLLKAMENSNMVIQDPFSHQYYLGQLFAQMVSSPHTTHASLIVQSIQKMRQLSVITEETIVLSVLMGFQHIRLHTIQSQNYLRVIEERSTAQINPGSISRVLLSQLDDSLLKVVVSHVFFKPIIDQIPVSKEKLLRQIKQVRKQGYSVSFGESMKGVLAISCPIKNYALPAAIGILGPESRIKPSKDEFVQELMAAATYIDHLLAGTLKVPK